MCSQVYYSPAFLRQSIGDALTALRMLAEVYRAARILFPLEEDFQGSNVIVHIDQLKAAGSAADVCTTCGNGQVWLLVCTGSSEAVVQAVSLFDGEGGLSARGPPQAHQVLRIGTPMLTVPADTASESAEPDC